MSVCLQAVETNLASKDSHWVFVNEVRRDTHRHSEHLTLDRASKVCFCTNDMKLVVGNIIQNFIQRFLQFIHLIQHREDRDVFTFRLSFQTVQIIKSN